MDDGHGRARCTATVAMATSRAAKNQKIVIASKVAPANFFPLFQCQKQ
jgi:predicted phosphoribosyltransferase